MIPGSMIPARRLVVAVVALRIGGFAAVSAAARSPAAVLAVYGVPLVAILLSSLLIFYGPRVRAFNAALARAVRGRFRGPRLAPAA